MTDNEQQLAALDRQIASAKETLETGKALARLLTNPDFKKVVIEGYLKDEAIRLVHLRGDPQLQDSLQQAGILRDIDGVGSFKTFLDVAAFKGRDAERFIADAEAQKQEIEEEEAE